LDPDSTVRSWKLKSETDLYEFKKVRKLFRETDLGQLLQKIFRIQSRSSPTSLSFSPDYSKFVVFSFKDRHVRVFTFATGKLLKKYDESLESATEKQGIF
jgi:peptidylprolyl isomerase domain and WD repeat-containing protein 1